MRGSDLIGLPVLGPDGRHGKVIDVRLVQDGPLMGAYAALRVDSLVVGHHTLAAHLGYDRAGTNGPLLVNAFVNLITRHNRQLPWSDCRVEDGAVRTDRVVLDSVDQI